MIPSKAVEAWGSQDERAAVIAQLVKQLAAPRQVGMAHHDARQRDPLTVTGGRS